jgi:hypothetical protein
MRVRMPSPAMVVALIALFVASSGTAVAVVGYARNAGAVDGKSAVYSGARLSQAAGKLVATNRSGSDRGKIPGKFLADVGRAAVFGQAFEVADNQTVAATQIGSIAGFGTLSATCGDQAAGPGVEDPRTVVTFANRSGGTANFARRVGNGEGTVGALPNGVGDTFAIAGSNTFRLHLNKADGSNALVDGVVRQDGRGGPAAICVVYGVVLGVS